MVTTSTTSVSLDLDESVCGAQRRSVNKPCTISAMSYGVFFVVLRISSFVVATAIWTNYYSEYKHHCTH